MVNNMTVTATDGNDAVAQTLNDLCTAEQYRAIAKLAAELEVEADKASYSLFEATVDELSKSGAKDLIDYLRKLKGV